MTNSLSDYKKFNPLNVSSKFAICGLPLRVDTYKTCSFGCKYCFANNRKIMEFSKELQIGDLEYVKNKLHKIFDRGVVDRTNFLESLIADGYTWHCGGMSDPFQPVERELQITKQLIDITKSRYIYMLFSTKSDTVYGANIDPELHSFQLSVSNVDNRKELEPNIPDIQKRIGFFKELKKEGFKVGIRIQPFIPNISTLDIIKSFEGADNFTLEGLKFVPQNEEQKEEVLGITGINRSDFIQMGLLNLKPEIRLRSYEPFIEYFEQHNIKYSIADNDLHHLGNNKCCCGDCLVHKATTFNNTYLTKEFGDNYTKDNVDQELLESGLRDCRCNQLFTSNRQEDGAVTVQDFFDKRFYRKSSPFSPKFLYKTNNRQLSLF